jgi:hypothetical protein
MSYYSHRQPRRTCPVIEPPPTAGRVSHRHGLAAVLAFRTAAWLPYPPPPLPLRYIEITEELGGSCVAANIYSTQWSVDCIAPPYRPLMEAQLVIELAGGVAEAVHRGEGRAREVLRFARLHCCIDEHLERAAAVLGDLRRLTGHRYDAQAFAERTLALMLDNWRAVTALAAALVERRRVAGEDVERIIDHSA